MHAELLINVDSRRSREALPSILAACETNGISIDKCVEVGRGVDLGRTIGAMKRRGVSRIIAGGGDGTISDVIDHLVDSSISLGIIPLGTTNNFARSLGLPLAPEDAVRTIARTDAKAVDLGKVHHDYFANVVGVGISAVVAQNVTDSSKKLLGRAAYAYTGLKELLRHKPFTVTIQDKDRELAMKFETHQMIIANGRYHAGKEVARDASLTSRELVIFKLGNRSKLSFIWHTIDFYVGRRKSISHASYILARDIIVTTSSPQSVELDGEVKFHTPLTLQVASEAVRIHH